MKENKLSIPFKLVNIEEKQFSVFEEELNEEASIQEKVGTGFGVNLDQSIIASSIHYLLTKKDKPFINLEVVCYFEVEKEAFRKNIVKGKKVMLPKEFAKHLAVITSGTARGILYANTKNTSFNEYVMSLLNIDDLIKEDIVIEI